MIVLPEVTMRTLMQQIVGATQGLVDAAGRQVMTSTIAEPQLRQAALVALQIATGETIWPADRKIKIERPQRTHEIFEEV